MEPRAHGDGIESAGFAYPPFVPSPTARANRRRLLVFIGVFVAAAAVGSVTRSFVRPSTARPRASQITPAGEPRTRRACPTGAGAGSPKPFLTEVEVLASRPVLGEVVARLGAAGEKLADLGPDPSRGHPVVAGGGAGRGDERRGDRRARGRPDRSSSRRS